jgi:hypothetical protein
MFTLCYILHAYIFCLYNVILSSFLVRVKLVNNQIKCTKYNYKRNQMLYSVVHDIPHVTDNSTNSNKLLHLHGTNITLLQLVTSQSTSFNAF